MVSICTSVLGRTEQNVPTTISPFVPIHNWSCSSLNVSLTFPPDLLYIPDKGTVGNRSCLRNDAVSHHVSCDIYIKYTCEHKRFALTFVPLIAVITSSGLPLSKTFLCCWKEKNKTNYHKSSEMIYYVCIFMPLPTYTSTQYGRCYTLTEYLGLWSLYTTTEDDLDRQRTGDSTWINWQESGSDSTYLLPA